MTNEIIKVTTNEEGQHLVSARELHDVLLVQEGKTERFSQWFNRHLQYGFEENVDFTSVKIFTVVNNGAKRELDDYAMTIDMAKELAMLQKSSKGREIRKYFIECEKQLKSQKPQLTREQFNVLTLYEMGGQKAVDIALEIKQSGIEVGLNIGKGQGMKRLCENGVVTIPIIMDYIKEYYPNEFAYTCDIPTTEWTRYLRHMGYLKTQHFARKDGKGMEAKWSYQPTEMFNEVFVEQGMAIVREIDKGRGKVEISYTIEIEKYLLTDNFKNTFFGYLDKIYPKIDEVVA